LKNPNFKKVFKKAEEPLPEKLELIKKRTQAVIDFFI